MGKAVGMVEYKTISTGMKAADLIMKTANVNLLEAKAVSPGKYIVLFSGELGAVLAVSEAAKTQYSDQFLDSFILGNPHRYVMAAFNGNAHVERIESLGIIETSTVASVMVAADAAAKSAGVKIVKIEIEEGLCGKSYLLVTGTVSEVTESVKAAVKAIGEEVLIDSAVIPSPDEKFWKTLV